MLSHDLPPSFVVQQQEYYPSYFLIQARDKFTTMVHKKLTVIISFFLGLLFVTHIGLMASSAHAHQDKDVLATPNGGRKLMIVALKEIVREGPKIKNGGISKISGEDVKAASTSPGRPQESLNSQEAAIQETSDDERITSRQQSGTTVNFNDESRRLLEAAKEIVSLMHKDYKGMGGRKPPINNHEPSH